MNAGLPLNTTNEIIERIKMVSFIQVTRQQDKSNDLLDLSIDSV